MPPSERSGPLRSLGQLLISLVMLVGLLLFVGLDLSHDVMRRRGIESGLSPNLPHLERPRFGTNVSLERYRDDVALLQTLTLIRDSGLGTVRQRFAWADLEPVPGEYRWEEWDRILPMVRDNGLQVVAVLDTSPAWARGDGEEHNRWAPPRDPNDLARFAAILADRYRNEVTAYQIWDRPNIAPHWGLGEIVPRGYVELLSATTRAIRGVNPRARIISAALAPNLESGGRNMSDVRYLREIYRRGAGDYFDVLGAVVFGFWSGPHDRRVRDDVLNYSRVILLREEMVRRGDAHKPIWAMEGGWCALPQDWSGEPSPQGSDVEAVQAERLTAALIRAQREWPWMGLLCVQHWQPSASPQDPVWGYALLDGDGRPREIMEQLRTATADQALLYPGLNSVPHERLAAPGQDEMTELEYWGTDVALDVDRGVAVGELAVGLDGQLAVDQVTLEGRRELVRVRIDGGLAPEVHRLRIAGSSAQRSAVRGVSVGYRPDTAGSWAKLTLGCLGLAFLVWNCWRAGRRLAWRAWWASTRVSLDKVPPGLRWAATLMPLALLVSPGTGCLRLIGAALYAIVGLAYPQHALYVLMACVPLAPLHIRLGPGSFSVTELGLLVAVAAQAWEWLLRPSSTEQGSCWPPRLRLSFLDWGVLLFCLLACGTSLVAEYRRVALRELRTVVFEPALFYMLIRTWPPYRRKPRVLLDLLWVAGLSVALHALAVYPTAEGVIEAEGVRRARSIYGSPNNLALMLERVLPLGLALGLGARSRWRRWLYGLGTGPVALALFLTYSRGSWLLGIPAILIGLVWLGERSLRWPILALAMAGLLTAIPLAGTERIVSLVDPSQGTTFLRISLWQAAWEMVRDHPWLGIGLDNFLYYYGDYVRSGAEVDRWLSHPHNLVLDSWLRLGVGGLATVLALLTGFTRRALTHLDGLCEGDLRSMGVGLVVAMIASVAHGLVDSFYFVPELAYSFMLAIAWVAILDAPPAGRSALHANPRGAAITRP